MISELALSTEDRAEVDAILAQVAPGIEVWAYGSRVNGTSYEASDLDLVLRGVGLRPVNVSIVSALIDAFEESTLPIIVDIHDWVRLPPAYQEEIERSYYILVPAE